MKHLTIIFILLGSYVQAQFSLRLNAGFRTETNQISQSNNEFSQNNNLVSTYQLDAIYHLNNRWGIGLGLSTNRFNYGSRLNKFPLGGSGQVVSFIGIPVSVSYKFIDKRKFSIGASTGSQLIIKRNLEQISTLTINSAILNGQPISMSKSEATASERGVAAIPFLGWDLGYKLSKKVEILYRGQQNFGLSTILNTKLNYTLGTESGNAEMKTNGRSVQNTIAIQYNF